MTANTNVMYINEHYTTKPKTAYGYYLLVLSCLKLAILMQTLTSLHSKVTAISDAKDLSFLSGLEVLLGSVIHLVLFTLLR